MASQRFEYKVETLTGIAYHQAETKLNLLAKDGWRVISISAMTAGEISAEYVSNAKGPGTMFGKAISMNGQPFSTGRIGTEGLMVVLERETASRPTGISK